MVKIKTKARTDAILTPHLLGARFFFFSHL